MKIHTRARLSAPYGGRPTRSDVGWEPGTEHPQLDTLLKKYSVSVPRGS